jgi:hypothetical protein
MSWLGVIERTEETGDDAASGELAGSLSLLVEDHPQKGREERALDILQLL